MNRREFITLLGGAAAASSAAWPLAVRAQERVHRVGFMWDSPKAFHDALEAFRSGLRELGYVEGKTIAMEYRYAEGNPERMRAFAEEFVRLKVDAIVAPTSIYTAAAKRATSTIPIVFMGHADPLGTGHVASLAQPGGNATGLSLMMTETNVKLLELFKDAVPTLSRVAVVFDPNTPSHTPGLAALKAAGPKLDIRISRCPWAALPSTRPPLRPWSANAQRQFCSLRHRFTSPIPSGLPTSRWRTSWLRCSEQNHSCWQAASSAMPPIATTCGAAARLSWTRCSEASIRPIFQSSSRQSSSW